jgi:pyruvate/2-oxoglutarate dehydrogenase complex dihydrolipoamide acyltransferase (E2) component
MPHETRAETDKDGIAKLKVWPNELGTEGSEYIVTIRYPNYHGNPLHWPGDGHPHMPPHMGGRQHAHGQCCDDGMKTLRAYAVVPNIDCNLWHIIEFEPYEMRGAGHLITAETIYHANLAAESAATAVAAAEEASASAATATDAAQSAQESAAAAAESAAQALASENAAAESAASANTSKIAAANSAAEALAHKNAAEGSAGQAFASQISAANSAAVACECAAKAEESANRLISLEDEISLYPWALAISAVRQTRSAVVQAMCIHFAHIRDKRQKWETAIVATRNTTSAIRQAVEITKLYRLVDVLAAGICSGNMVFVPD